MKVLFEKALVRIGPGLIILRFKIIYADRFYLPTRSLAPHQLPSPHILFDLCTVV